MGGVNQAGWSGWVVTSSWVENKMLGGKYQVGWRICWVENIKVGGNIKVTGE